MFIKHVAKRFIQSLHLNSSLGNTLYPHFSNYKIEGKVEKRKALFFFGFILLLAESDS